MNRRFLATTIFGVALLAPAGFGQVAKREANQQKRIAGGVESGQLTPKETARLENKEAKINREVHRDRKQNGGNLTNKEKAQINRQQNQVSRDIYRQKHDAQTQHK